MMLTANKNVGISIKEDSINPITENDKALIEVTKVDVVKASGVEYSFIIKNPTTKIAINKIGPSKLPVTEFPHTNKSPNCNVVAGSG